MKKLLYLSLILVSTSCMIQASWFSRLFGFGEQRSDAEQAAKALANGAPDPQGRPAAQNRNAAIADILNGADLPQHDRDEIQREVIKHHVLHDFSLNDEKARQQGEFQAKVKRYEHAASPGFIQKIPGKVSAGALDAIQNLIAQAGVVGGRIAFQKALESYQDKNLSPEERVYIEGLKKLEEKAEKANRISEYINAEANLIALELAQEAAQEKLNKLKKMQEEKAKKKAEAEEQEHKLAIAEQQGSAATA